MKETVEEHRVRVHESKRRWHQEQANLPYEEKVRILLQMQRELLPIIAARRELKWWEKAWDIEP